jgi:hypothetical protein
MIQGKKTLTLVPGRAGGGDEVFWSRICQPGLFPVNELAMDFPAERVDNGYLKVLIVAQAVVAEMLRKLFAVRDSLKIAVEVDPGPVS